MSFSIPNPQINFEFSSKGGKVFQLNSWQSCGVAQTLIELERRLGSEWYLRYANCRDKRIDYVLVYKDSDDNNIMRKEARDRFEGRLLDDNLELVRWRRSDCWELDDDESDEVFVLVHTPFDRLALECQSVKFEMPLKEQSHPRLEGCCSIDWLKTDNEVDFITAPFNLTRLAIYENSNNLKDFFQPAIASFLTHHILMNTDSDEDDKIRRGTTTKGLSYLLHTKVYEDAFILHPYSPKDPINTTRTQMVAHDICLHSTASGFFATHREKPDVRKELADTWCRWFKFQPLWKIRNYFGEKLAFYFAWLGLLTSSLIIPTFLGSGVFVFGVSYTSTRNVTNYYDWMLGCFDNRATPVFAVIMCVWGTLFLELWKRKHCRLQFEWDVDRYDENEPDRPQFYGSTVIEDPVTKLQEVRYPLLLKNVKFAASLLIVFTMVLVVLASLVGVIVYRLIFEYDWLGEDRFERVPGDHLLPILSASILNGISILVLKLFYNRVALKLTDWENHRTQSAYEDSLVVKLFAFHFADSYASLFYIAFFRNAKFSDGVAGLGDKYHDSCGNYNDCMTMLTIQVTVLMLMQPLPTVIQAYFWPWVKKMCKRKRKGSGAGVRIALHYPHREFALKVHQVAHLVEQQRHMNKVDNFHLHEYSEKVIMYGYLMIFATAFPLAPLVALLTNKFDLRLDAKRLVWHTRRPVAEIAHNIGVWQQVLLFINIVAVVSNGFLIAFTSDFGKDVVKDYGDEGRLWLLVVFEHVVFIIMFLVSFCIPDLPQDVKNAKQRDRVVLDQMTQDYAVESLQRDYDLAVKRPSNIEVVRRPMDVSLKSFGDEDWLSQ